MPLQTKLPRKELFEAPLTKSIDSPYKGLSQSPRRELEFELIPRCMHHKNVRAVVPRDIWALLRHICLRFDGAKCGECSSTENLECHEVWEYRTEPVRVMKLAKLRILCHLCHLGKHIGFAGICGEYLEVEAQQLTLYSLSKMQLASHRRIAYKKARELDQGGMFELDLTYLTTNDSCGSIIGSASSRRMSLKIAGSLRQESAATFHAGLTEEKRIA